VVVVDNLLLAVVVDRKAMDEDVHLEVVQLGPSAFLLLMKE
jgi:hypothetical protein